MSEQAYWAEAQTEVDQGTERTDRGLERFPSSDGLSPCAKVCSAYRYTNAQWFREIGQYPSRSNKFRTLIGYSSSTEDIMPFYSEDVAMEEM
jgi:hypothetical protein